MLAPGTMRLLRHKMTNKRFFFFRIDPDFTKTLAPGAKW